jgi:hypothetical protein
MAITQAYVGSATVSTTEFSLVNGSTTSADITTGTGIYQLFMDLANIDNGTVYALKIKDRVTSVSTQQTVHYETLPHAQGNAKNYATPALVLMHGYEFSLTLVTGSATVVAWSIRKTA